MRLNRDDKIKLCLSDEERRELNYELRDVLTPEKLKNPHFLKKLIYIIPMGGLVGVAAVKIILEAGPSIISMARSLIAHL